MAESGGRRRSPSQASSLLCGRLQAEEGESTETAADEAAYEATDIVAQGPRPVKGDIVEFTLVKIKLTGTIAAKRVMLVVPKAEQERVARPLDAFLGSSGKRRDEIRLERPG